MYLEDTMNHWNDVLDEIKNRYNLRNNVRNTHMLYSTMKRKAKGYIGELLDFYLNSYDRAEIVMLCQRKNSWIESLFKGCNILVLDNINDISDVELKEKITIALNGIHAKCIVSLCDYVRNLRISQIIYDMKEFHYIDLDYYLKYRGIDVRRTDFSMDYSIKYAPYWLRDWIGYYAQKNSTLKKWLNKPIWRTMLYGDGWVSFREYNISYLSWKNGLLSDRDYALRNCLGMLIDVRDFPTLFDITAQNDYDDLKKEIVALLDGLNERINQRSKRAAVFNWVDNVAYGKLGDMPWLNSRKEQWINFSNVHSSACWTEMEMKVLLSGEHPIKDKLFLKKDADTDCYKVLEQIEKYGYKFIYIGENSTGCNIFPDKNLSFSKIREDDYTDSQVQWEAICYLAEEDVPLFMLIHNNWQTHSPYFSMTYSSPEHRNYLFATEEQKKASREYSDTILKFYETFYGTASRYYFSDHGDLALKEADYVDLQSHIIFIAHVNKGSEFCEETGLLSTAELGEVILRLENGEGYEDCFMNTITVDSYDIYGGRVDYVKSHGLKKELWMQCEAVRGADDVLVRYADGEQKYFLIQNLEQDLHDDEKYQNRICEMEKAFSEFIDISCFEYFNKSVELYNYFGLDYTGWKKYF